MTRFSSLVAWVVSALEFISPSERQANLTTYPEAQETAEERRERYQQIAETIVDVVWDEDEEPLFPGRLGRFRTAALVVAVANYESGLRRDVLSCAGAHSRGSGVDSGALQVRLPRGAFTAEGWTAEEVCGDLGKQFRSGLHLMQRSFRACSKEAADHRLSAFTSGRCDSVIGGATSKPRMASGRRLFERMPPPVEEGISSPSPATIER